MISFVLQEALRALLLSEDQVTDTVSSQLLPLIRQSQSKAEERLAALDVSKVNNTHTHILIKPLCKDTSSLCVTLQVSCDSVVRHSLTLSSCVFGLMNRAALLWESHCCNVKNAEEELQQHLDDFRHSQERQIQVVLWV